MVPFLIISVIAIVFCNNRWICGSLYLRYSERLGEYAEAYL